MDATENTMLPAKNTTNNNTTKKQPMSGKERIKKIRQRKQEADPNFRLQENARIKEVKKRSKQNASNLELLEMRRKNREYVCASRLKKKTEAQSETFVLNGVGFKISTIFGKSCQKNKRKAAYLSTQTPPSNSGNRGCLWIEAFEQNEQFSAPFNKFVVL